MSKFEVTARASVDYDAAIIGLANHLVSYPNASPEPTLFEAQAAIESMFWALGELGLHDYLDGAEGHEDWAQEQVERLWPDLKPPSAQTAA